ncbi:MAG: sulfur carrier protein ThiS [Bacillota bacterium]
MQITVNGKQEKLVKEISINEFLEKKDQDPKTVVVEYNGKIVKREKWSEILLQENDKLEILKFVGGGC